MEENKKFPFAKSKTQKNIIKKVWKVLVVDDEEEVHTITCSVLKNFVFEDRKLEFIHAYSCAEAKKVMSEQSGIAIILLDVVMEKDDSGLEVARYIREDLKNDFIQIILRTGQPGSAPEKKVIQDYEINDYKEKTELTATKLFTIILTSLRAYKNLIAIEKNRLGLEKIIDSTRILFDQQTENKFIQGVLTQMEALLNLDDESLYVKHSGISAVHQKNEFVILASTGEFEDLTELLPEVKKALQHAVEIKDSYFDDDIYVGYFKVDPDEEHLIYFQGCRHLSESSRKIIHIFAGKVTVALENLYLNKEMVDTKREIINTLGNVVESRSKETANHVQRMAEVSHLLAVKYGLDEEEAMLLKNASPMHDVGKVGIPDRILLKRGTLNEEEHGEMKHHANIGYDILKGSARDLIKAAATIALEHHEKYDGSGYPQGLKEEEIHIYGRITMIADVFDALYYKRYYKDPWSADRIIEYFKEERGKAFDPQLTDIFLENFDEIIKISEAFGD